MARRREAGTGGERGLRTARLRPFANDVGDSWIEFHPIGVLLAVEPWNLPIYELTRVIAVGNPVRFLLTFRAVTS